MLNKVTLQGRLVRDVEIRRTQSDIPVASFTVAWSEKYKETETKCFLPCTAWRQTGEFIDKYFRKGQEIIVEGQLHTRSYVDNDGNNRNVLELTVDKAHFCGPKSSGSGDSSNTYSAPSGGVTVTGGFEEVNEDTLPF